jgi:hypothetical protein
MGSRSGPREAWTSSSSQLTRVIRATRAITARHSRSRSHAPTTAAAKATISPSHCQSSRPPTARVKRTSGSTSASGGPYAS